MTKCLTTSAAWAGAEALARAINDASGTEAQLVELTALEEAALHGPIHTPRDALAKLKAAGLTFERGDRLDGADRPAYLEAVAWLDAYFGRPS
jgi:hypothetical protein